MTRSGMMYSVRSSSVIFSRHGASTGASSCLMNVQPVVQAVAIRRAYIRFFISNTSVLSVFAHNEFRSGYVRGDERERAEYDPQEVRVQHILTTVDEFLVGDVSCGASKRVSHAC